MYARIFNYPAPLLCTGIELQRTATIYTSTL